MATIPKVLRCEHCAKLVKTGHTYRNMYYCSDCFSIAQRPECAIDIWQDKVTLTHEDVQYTELVLKRWRITSADIVRYAPEYDWISVDAPCFNGSNKSGPCSAIVIQDHGTRITNHWQLDDFVLEMRDVTQADVDAHNAEEADADSSSEHEEVNKKTERRSSRLKKRAHESDEEEEAADAVAPPPVKKSKKGK